MEVDANFSLLYNANTYPNKKNLQQLTLPNADFSAYFIHLYTPAEEKKL